MSNYDKKKFKLANINNEKENFRLVDINKQRSTTSNLTSSNRLLRELSLTFKEIIFSKFVFLAGISVLDIR